MYLIGAYNPNTLNAMKYLFFFVFFNNVSIQVPTPKQSTINQKRTENEKAGAVIMCVYLLCKTSRLIAGFNLRSCKVNRLWAQEALYNLKKYS